jgi:bifunctional non-homologous end joining protein LigD
VTAERGCPSDVPIHDWAIIPNIIFSMDVKNFTGAKAADFPGIIKPMQPILIPRPFSDPDWIFEPKIDGFRGLVYIKGKVVRIISRNGRYLTPYFKGIAESFVGLGHQAVIDGEIMALAPDNRPCFECLQQHIGMSQESPSRHPSGRDIVVYYTFDILYLDGYDLLNVPILERKKLLSPYLKVTDRIKLLDFYEAEGELLYEKAVEQGFEGVVAKKKDSIYIPGKESRLWLKAKASLTGEFVIGGFTLNESGNLRELIVGQFEDGKLIYKGTVGTGLKRIEREQFLDSLSRQRVETPPFSEELKTDGTPVWIKPDGKVQVKFAQWTHGGHFRDPIFIRLID